MPTKVVENAAIAVIEEIEGRIYVIRGQRVMLDSDLAEVYGVTTKRLKEQVRRNISRFPKDFVFELDLEETRHLESLRSQNATLDELRRGKYSKYGAFAFTEHGAVMLASVLNSRTAVEASIIVVRAFVQMRSVLALHKDLAKRVDKLTKVAIDHDNEFGVVWELLGEVMGDSKPLKRKIGFVDVKKGKAKR